MPESINSITAVEARDLADSVINSTDYLAEAYNAIRESALEGKKFVQLCGPFWSEGLPPFAPAYKIVKQTLESDGFKVDWNCFRTTVEW